MSMSEIIQQTNQEFKLKQENLKKVLCWELKQDQHLESTRYMRRAKLIKHTHYPKKKGQDGSNQSSLLGMGRGGSLSGRSGSLSSVQNYEQGHPKSVAQKLNEKCSKIRDMNSFTTAVNSYELMQNSRLVKTPTK